MTQIPGLSRTIITPSVNFSIRGEVNFSIRGDEPKNEQKELDKLEKINKAQEDLRKEREERRKNDPEPKPRPGKGDDF